MAGKKQDFSMPTCCQMDNPKIIASRSPKNEEKRRRKRELLKTQFESRQITNFEQVFDVYSKSALAEGIYISFYTFTNKKEDPGQFTLHDISRLANLFNLEFSIALDFILTQFKTVKK